MISVRGYYENGVCIPTETLDIENRQQVITPPPLFMHLKMAPPMSRNDSVVRSIYDKNCSI